jgi:hypothetical protein
MPDISAYSTPLSAAAQNNRKFLWTPLYEKCFQQIKLLACRSPILKLINPALDEPIWVITDGCQSGVGAMYGQGKDWETCRPAGFLSRKFNTAQHNYTVPEQETLAAVEALAKWQDKLLGRKFILVTDNAGLSYFQTAPQLSP